MIRTEEPTRQRLAAFVKRLPWGSKGQFAKLCGFADRRRMRAVSRFNAYLTPNVAKRLESIMDQVERGEIILAHKDKRLYWRRQACG